MAVSICMYICNSKFKVTMYNRPPNIREYIRYKIYRAQSLTQSLGKEKFKLKSNY